MSVPANLVSLNQSELLRQVILNIYARLVLLNEKHLINQTIEFTSALLKHTRHVKCYCYCFVMTLDVVVDQSRPFVLFDSLVEASTRV